MPRQPHFRWAIPNGATGGRYVTPWPLSVPEALAIDPQAQALGLPVYLDPDRHSPEHRHAMAGAVRAAIHAALLIQTIQRREARNRYTTEAARDEGYRHAAALFDRASSFLAQLRCDEGLDALRQKPLFKDT